MMRPSRNYCKAGAVCALAVIAGYAAIAAPAALFPATVTVGIVGLSLISFPGALLLFMGTLPFQPAWNILPAYDLHAARILVPALLLSAVMQAKLHLRGRRRVMQAAGIGVSFLFAAGISLFFADNAAWGARKLLFFLSIAPLFLLGALFAQYVERYSSFIFLIPAALLSALGIAQFFGQFLVGAPRMRFILHTLVIPLFRGKNMAALIAQHSSIGAEIAGTPIVRATALFPDPHTYTAFLGVGYAYALASFLFSRRSRRPFIVLALALTTGAVFLTFVRSAYIAIAVTTALLIFLRVGLRGKRQIIKMRPVSVFILCLSGFALLFLSPLLTDRIQATFSPYDISGPERISLWHEAARTLFSRPLTGVGLGNLPRIMEPGAPYRSPINAHNGYLEFGAELGVGGLALFLAGLIFLERSYRRAFRRDIRTPPLVYAAYGSLLWFSVQNLFETSVYDPVSLGLLLSLWGAALGLTTLRHSHFRP